MENLKKIIDGKKYSEKFLKEIYPLSNNFFKKFGRKPCLAVILVGDNTASRIYVKNKVHIAEKNGVQSLKVTLSSEVSEANLLNEILKLNENQNVESNKIVKEISVQILGAANPGSGVLVRREGEKYIVLTAWHVIKDNLPG